MYCFFFFFFCPQQNTNYTADAAGAGAALTLGFTNIDDVRRKEGIGGKMALPKVTEAVSEKLARLKFRNRTE